MNETDWLDELSKTSSVIGESKPFQEAIDFLKTKVVMSYAEYKGICIKYKALAFSVAGYTQLEVLNQFYQELLLALEEGTTIQQFRTNMNDFLEKNGYQGLSKHRSDIIFRTNLQTAYNVGHYKQMIDVQKERPYWMYLTAGDSRVRDTHQAMDGKVYHANSPIWKRWYPPNGFGCRCSVVSLTKEQVKNRGLGVEIEPPYVIDPVSKQLKVAMPEEAFRTNPALAEWEPDVTGFPKVLKKIWKEQNKKN